MILKLGVKYTSPSGRLDEFTNTLNRGWLGVISLIGLVHSLALAYEIQQPGKEAGSGDEQETKTF